MFYKVPENLASELEELDSYIGRYRSGEIDAATLKVRRVPFGCYEQRTDGTYMVRIRTTGGALTPRQLRTVARSPRAMAIRPSTSPRGRSSRSTTLRWRISFP